MLVVDDHELNLRLVERVLVERGFDVECASSGPEALAAVDRCRPDLIVLDVVMPKMSGLEVLEQLRSSPRLATIPVIMLTARSDDEDVLAGYRAGADYFIAKPLVPRQLLYGVGLVLGRELPAKQGDPVPTGRASRSPGRD